MAKRKKNDSLPPQFVYPAPGLEKDKECPTTKLQSYLSSLFRDWDTARRNEIVPTWQKAWKYFNSIVESDEIISSRGKKTWRSKAFHPLTEQKVMAGVSQIDDVLFRSGDFPYSFKVSPVSDAGLVNVSFDQNEGITPEVEKQLADRALAERRMRMMKKKVDDQLAECDAINQARDATFMAVLYGTAAIEAPVIVCRVRNKWSESGGGFKLKREEEDTPAVVSLDIWDCWPDPNCGGDVQKGRGFFHRQAYTLAELMDLRDLVTKKGEDFDYRKDEFDALIEFLLKENGEENPADGGTKVSRIDDRPWLESGDLNTAGVYDVLKFAGAVPNAILRPVISDIDPGEGFTEVIVHMCEGKIIKASKNPFPRQRRPYCLMPFTRVPGSPWGRGVPQKIFDYQENINRLLRQYIDNKRLSGNLMTAIDRSKLKSGEGLESYPGRNWEFEQGYTDSDVRKLIQPIILPDTTGGVLEAIQMMMVWADMASGIPRILEGQAGGDGQANTAFAENQRIISASKQLGLVLKNFDMFGWVPVVESFYDWNMEFADEPEVKGEYEVIATGFASFENKNMKKLDLERIMLMGQQNPVLASRLKVAPVLEDWFQTSSLDVDRYLRSEAEAQAAADEQNKAAMDQQQAMLQLQQAMQDREHAAELELVKAKAEFSGMTRTQLEQMRAEAKMVMDRMKIEAQKLIKAAELELGHKKLEVDRGNSARGALAGGTGFVGGGAQGVGSARKNPRRKSPRQRTEQ